MKSFKYLIAALMVAGLAARSYATITIDFSVDANAFLADDTGAYLYGMAEIGTFASAPTVGSPSLAGFSEFGSITVSDGAFSPSFDTGTAGPAFSHNQLYLVAFNANFSQTFIGYVSDSQNSNWKFPTDSDPIPTTTIDLGDFFVGGGGTTQLAPGAVIVYGKVGLDPSGPYSLLETVPEPSTVTLVGFGLLGVIGMICRRSYVVRSQSAASVFR
ncbi:MAG: PEP-CTERM sorting domain-containing protein [Verrucomicrobiia bacterium]